MNQSENCTVANYLGVYAEYFNMWYKFHESYKHAAPFTLPPKKFLFSSTPQIFIRASKLLKILVCFQSLTGKKLFASGLLCSSIFTLVQCVNLFLTSCSVILHSISWIKNKIFHPRHPYFFRQTATGSTEIFKPYFSSSVLYSTAQFLLYALSPKVQPSTIILICRTLDKNTPRAIKSATKLLSIYLPNTDRL